MILFGALNPGRDSLGMFETFIKNSSIQDLASYVIIIVIIFGLSPYGLFFLRMGLHLVFGAPRPRIMRGTKKTHAQVLQDVSEQARTRIDEMSAYIIELEDLLKQYQYGAHTLEAQNEALKEHIRAMEAGADMHGAQYDGEAPSPDSESNQALATLDLSPGASWENIRAAYRRLVKLHHPDHGGDPERLRQVNSAYDHLKRIYGKAG